MMGSTAGAATLLGGGGGPLALNIHELYTRIWQDWSELSNSINTWSSSCP